MILFSSISLTSKKFAEKKVTDLLTLKNFDKIFRYSSIKISSFFKHFWNRILRSWQIEISKSFIR